MLLTNGIGESIYDLRDNYPIELIYALYSKCNKQLYNNYWTEATIIKTALSTTTRYGDDKDSSRRKGREWKKFLDTLDLDSRAKKKLSGKDGKSFVNMFARAGIPIVDEQKK